MKLVGAPQVVAYGTVMSVIIQWKLDADWWLVKNEEHRDSKIFLRRTIRVEDMVMRELVQESCKFTFLIYMPRQLIESCADVDAWQKFQITLDLFRNGVQTK